MTVSFSLIPSRFKRKRIECHDSLGMARADNVTLTTVEVADKSEFRRDPAESFFLERYCAAYKAELAAFVDSVTSGAARGLVQFVHDGGELAPAYSVVVSGSDETVYKTTYKVANSLIKFLRKWTKSSTIRKMEALSWLSTCAGASI